MGTIKLTRTRAPVPQRSTTFHCGFEKLAEEDQYRRERKS